MSNKHLKSRNGNPNDEFYTQYEDIEKEINHYVNILKGKSIYCPCDSKDSNFFKYFFNNFKKLKLKKLCASDINGDVVYTIDGERIEYYNKEEDNYGDILGKVVQNRIQEYDIIITNPPFSKLKEFIQTLCEIKKDFILVGNLNVMVSRPVFPFVYKELIFNGFEKISYFITPDNSIKRFGNTIWITTLSTHKINSPLILKKEYNQTEYPIYDNYEAIEVGRVENIPKDYNGIMGVPITYFTKHCPEQFEILGFSKRDIKYDVPYISGFKDHGGNVIVNGIIKYSRIFIRKKGNKNET